MDCAHPLAPHDEVLQAYALDGEELAPEAARHLEQCRTCRERLVCCQDAAGLLTSQLYRRFCPTGTTLSLYAADLLSREQRQQVAAHVRDCPLCAEELVTSREFLAQPLFLPEHGPLRSLQRVVATLVRQQARLVTRSEQRAAAWPRQYHAGEVDLSLHLSRSSNGHCLLGIITSIDLDERVDAFEGARAELFPQTSFDGAYAEAATGRSVRAPLRARVDELGHLVFNGVPAGSYSMSIYLSEQEIVIEDLAIDGGSAPRV